MEMHIKYQFQHAAAKASKANPRANPSNAGSQNQPGDRKEYFAKRYASKVFVNDAIGRWNDLKTEAGVKSDEEFANTLLSLFETSRRIQLRLVYDDTITASEGDSDEDSETITIGNISSLSQLHGSHE
ncbi:Hypothetical predicted protein [Paramuricea clavata]|uniref:Uncharacterized protein n=1 Tax=Paramuricea clavata TaxID=317549 RepID=A0A6S7I311_PARCT|nr:Hypothetical predicted protein [Paramuricea clavata]